MANEELISVCSIEEAKERVDAYETATTSRFCCVRASKGFGRTDPAAKPHKVLWKDEHIPFSGVPFFVLGEKLLECHHGKDRNIGAKRKYQQNLEKKGSSNNGYTRRKRKLVNSKKLDCPAQIYMREVMFFSEYKIPEDSKSQRKRKNMSTKLRTAIKEGVAIESTECRIYINFPDKGSHKNHILGELQSEENKASDVLDGHSHEVGVGSQDTSSEVVGDEWFTSYTSQVSTHEVGDEVLDGSQVTTLEVGQLLHRSEAAQCRDLLAQLKCATFLLHNAEALATLRAELSEALFKVRYHIQHEDGIELEDPQPKPKQVRR